MIASGDVFGAVTVIRVQHAPLRADVRLPLFPTSRSSAKHPTDGPR